MPFVSIQTTEGFKEEAEKETFLKKISEAISKNTGKPETYCMISLVKSEMMIMGGDAGPAAYADVRAIGNFQPAVTKAISADFAELFSSFLSVPKSSLYISFSDYSPSCWGWNGGTF